MTDPHKINKILSPNVEKKEDIDIRIPSLNPLIKVSSAFISCSSFREYFIANIISIFLRII